MKVSLCLFAVLTAVVPVKGTTMYKIRAGDYHGCDLDLMVASCYDACASRHCSDRKVKKSIVEWTMDSRAVSSPAFKQVYWDCPVLLTTKEYGRTCRGEHSWAPGWMAEAIAEAKAKAKVDAKVDAKAEAKSPWWKKVSDILPSL